MSSWFSSEWFPQCWTQNICHHLQVSPCRQLAREETPAVGPAGRRGAGSVYAICYQATGERGQSSILGSQPPVGRVQDGGSLLRLCVSSEVISAAACACGSPQISVVPPHSVPWKPLLSHVIPS